MAISISLNGQNCQQVTYNREKDFEKLVIDNSETIFGKSSIYIDIKHRLENLSLGITIPDGVLIDLSKPDRPEFYLVEVELKAHDFRTHIYPQIDKFFDFYSNIQEQNKLTERIFSIFRQDDSLSSKLRDMIGSKEIFKFLKDILENSRNILIIIDGPKVEFEEKLKSRSETWGKMVKIQIVNHFRYEDHNIITSDSPFQKSEVSNTPIPPITKKSTDGNVRDIYSRIEQSFLKIKSTLRFNPTKNYIGVVDRKRIAYIQPKGKKVHLIVLMAEDEVKEVLRLKHHEVVSFSESRQRTWGGKNPSCAVNIYDTDHWDEIQKLISRLVEKHQET
jgi:predicted transport protein